MFAFIAGAAAGLLHVFSGPDHLAAIAPLAAEGPASRWKTGLQWGIGHTAGVLVIAALLLLLREQLPIESISSYSERVIGIALIALGCWGAWKASRNRRASHSHQRASFAMGTLHGLAGSSHLFGVLPALAFAARLDSGFYLGGFGCGAIAGMSAFAAGVGLVSGRINPRVFLFASSVTAVVIGGVWLVGR